MLEQALQDIGLDAAEAKVYLACLRLGTQDVKVISHETGLSRSDTVMILSGLVNKGFVSKFASAKDFFTAERPDVLLRILETNKSQMEKNIKRFSNILPDFADYINPAFTKPEIAFYEGREGMIAAWEDTLTSKTDIMAITNVDKTEAIFPEYVPKYYKRRKTAGILIKAIFPESKVSIARQKKDKEELRITKLLPKEMLDFEIELNIYDDKVAYFSVEESLAVIVKSKIIADSMRNVFGLCWKMAEKYEEDKKKKS